MALSTRRRFGATAMGVSLGPCAVRAQNEARVRIRARPGTGKPPEPGAHPLGRPQRDAILYAPESLPTDRASPLVVFLHGATGNEQRGLRFLSAYADSFGFLLLVPASAEGTWDAIGGDFGPDVRFIDRALDRAFGMCRVDPKKIAISGFSDGASYALGLGMSNGALFDAVMAFSPGFVPSGVQRQGRPRFFLSHGTADQILPIG